MHLDVGMHLFFFKPKKKGRLLLQTRENKVVRSNVQKKHERKREPGGQKAERLQWLSPPTNNTQLVCWFMGQLLHSAINLSSTPLLGLLSRFTQSHQSCPLQRK